MSKIIGVTVGTTLPKPNFKQTDPTKGDYIKNKPDFDGLKSKVEQIEVRVDTMQENAYDDTELRGVVSENVARIDTLNELVGNTKVETQIGDAIATLESEIDNKLNTMQSAIDSKVDAVDGMGLSTNDYTTSEKDKLATVEDYANFYEHPAHDSHDLGLYKVTVDDEGHVSDVALVEKEDIVALGIPAQDTTYEEEISDLSDRIDDVENSINTTNETLEGVAQEFESYKTTNNEAVATNASGIEANKTAIEAIQSDYLTSTDKTQLQDDIKKVSDKATANAAAIEILNGEGDGSVKRSINNAFNEFAANVTNDDVVNTYKELIDYAAQHGPEFIALVGKVDTIDANVGKVETDLSNYKTTVSEQFTEVDTTINNHIVDENNPHNVTKEQIGLDQVDNTPDLDKPISHAMDEALQGKADFEHMHGIEQINGLQDSLDELQANIDINAENIDTKADAEHNHDDLYYDKDEILGLITVEDIDDICASNQSSGEAIDFATVASKYWVEQYYQPKGNYLTKVPDGYATEEFVENNIAKNEEDIGDVNNLKTTKKNLTDAVNEVFDAVDNVSTAYSVTLTSKGSSDEFANVYELKQGNNVIGSINILKDMVVKSGEIVDIDGVKNIKLVLQNVENPLYIPVGSLVDIYTTKADATQVQISIDSNTREISAFIIPSSVTSVELSDNAIVTAKITDKNVTKAKLSSEVQATLDKAEVAEKNAKDYADNLNKAMDVRMVSAETKLTNIDRNNVVGKAHEHTNKSELDLIAFGDKAKWDKIVTDLADEIDRAKAAENGNAAAIAGVEIEAKKKVSSVSAGDNSVTMDGTATAPTIAVNLSKDEDNIIELAEDGLKVVAPATAEYTIEKTAGANDYDAVYRLMKDGAQVGASINIPKNMVVKSGFVKDGNIVLVLNDDADTEIVIPADSLIGHITSGSTDGDMVIINVSDDYKVTATIAGDSITMNKLSPDILDRLNDAHSHENADILDSINEERVAAWDAAKSHADSAHAPSNAEKNQNAFSNIAVGSTTIAADTTTDTVTFVGSNVTITPDATNDKITIGITKDNVTNALGYTPPTTNTTYGVVSTSSDGLAPKRDGSTTKFLRADGTWAVPPDNNTVYTHPTTSGNKHIPSGGSSGQILRWSADGTAVWGNDNNTTYNVATTSANGLMSTTMVSKLNGIAYGANKTTVDSAMSTTSTNPVQNKVVQAAITSAISSLRDEFANGSW